MRWSIRRTFANRIGGTSHSRPVRKPPFDGEQVKLGDVATLVLGQSPSSESYNTTGEGLPFYQGNADFGNEHPSTKVWCTEPKKTAEAGDLLLSVRAPIGAVNTAIETCCIGRGVAAIKPDTKCIDPNYLKAQLLARRPLLESMGTGSTFKAVGKKALSGFPITVCSMEDQGAIAKTLDSISKSMLLCAEADGKFDDLVKSRFVEMFSNRASGESVALQDCCSSIVGGKTPSMKHPEYYGGGIPFIKSGDVVGDRVFGGALSLSDAALERASVKMIPAGSVLVVTRSARLRKEVHCAVCANDVAINQDIKAFTPLPEFTSDYLLWAIRSHEPDLLKTVRSVSTSGMDLATLFGIGIRKAPLSLQRQFTTFVQRVDKLRFGRAKC